MTKFKTIKKTAPLHWASYLINGDPSSFALYDDGDEEIARIDAWAAKYGVCVDVIDKGFMHYNDAGELSGDTGLYIFHDHL